MISHDSSLTNFELGNILASLNNDTSALMAKSVLATNNHWANGAVLPEMHI